MSTNASEVEEISVEVRNTSDRGHFCFRSDILLLLFPFTTFTLSVSWHVVCANLRIFFLAPYDASKYVSLRWHNCFYFAAPRLYLLV